MKKIWAEAQSHLAGGVNSPVRAFKAVGGEPVFMRQGLGPYLYDDKGRSYADFCLSWGAILLGHAEQKTIEAIQKQAVLGTTFGTATELETRLAKEIKKAFAGMERLRFTSSGTEAVMSAIRLARGATKNERIVKFEGCYHGHADSLLVKAGSGLATFGSPDSDGVPRSLAELTSVLPYNDIEAARGFLRKKNDIACVIVEPIAGNMGLVPASQKFLDVLREETSKIGALLIFDEVISGFRACYGGAQHLYGIRPDITVLGKIIGGGLPVGAFGAKKEIMDLLSPNGSVYQAGTLSGNPLSMVAGFSVLSRLSRNFYNDLSQKNTEFVKKMSFIIKKKKLNACVQKSGSMFTLFFSHKTPKNFQEVLSTRSVLFRNFFHTMIKSGVYVPPSAFETSFISASHGENEFNKFLKALEKI